MTLEEYKVLSLLGGYDDPLYTLKCLQEYGATERMMQKFYMESLIVISYVRTTDKTYYFITQTGGRAIKKYGDLHARSISD